MFKSKEIAVLSLLLCLSLLVNFKAIADIVNSQDVTPFGVNITTALGTKLVNAQVEALGTERKHTKITQGETIQMQETQEKKQKKIKSLLQSLESEDRLVKARAIEDLGDLNVKEAVPKIIDSLQDEEWTVKAKACVALGKIKDERAIKPLIKVLENKQENWSIQLTAAKSLAQIGSAEAFEPLMRVLKYECDVERKKLEPPIPKSTGSDDEALERNYVGALIELCSKNKKQYVSTLIQYLKEEKPNPKYRFYLAKILGHLGKKEAVPVLIEYLEKSENGLIREDAAGILGDLGDKRAIEPLKKALKDNYICISTGDVRKNYGYVVRLAAYRSLLKLGVKVERYGNEYRVVK